MSVTYKQWYAFANINLKTKNNKIDVKLNNKIQYIFILVLRENKAAIRP